MRDPPRNISMASRYDHLTEKSTKILPKRGWKAHAVRRYAEPYQPISAVDLNSEVI